MKKKRDVKAKKIEDVILLRDLAPRKDVKGGAGKLLFGEHLETAERSEAVPEPNPATKSKETQRP